MANTERLFKVVFQIEKRGDTSAVTRALNKVAKAYAPFKDGLGIGIKKDASFDATLSDIQNKLDSLKDIDLKVSGSGKLNINDVTAAINISNSAKVEIYDGNINIGNNNNINIEQNAFSGLRKDSLNSALKVTQQIASVLKQADDFAKGHASGAAKASQGPALKVDIAKESEDLILGEIEKLVAKVQKTVLSRDVNTIYLKAKAQLDDAIDINTAIIEPLRTILEPYQKMVPIEIAPTILEAEDKSIQAAIKKTNTRIRNVLGAGESETVNLPTALEEIKPEEITSQISKINKAVKEMDSYVHLKAKIDKIEGLGKKGIKIDVNRDDLKNKVSSAYNFAVDEFNKIDPELKKKLDVGVKVNYENKDGVQIKVDDVSLKKEIAYAYDVAVRNFNQEDDGSREKVNVAVKIKYDDEDGKNKKTSGIKVDVNEKYLNDSVVHAIRAAISSYNNSKKKKNEVLKVSPDITSSAIRQKLQEEIDKIKNPPKVKVDIVPSDGSLGNLSKTLARHMEAGFNRALKASLKEQASAIQEAFNNAKTNATVNDKTRSSTSKSSKKSEYDDMSIKELREEFLRILNDGTRKGQDGYFRPGDLNNRSRENLISYIEQIKKVRQETVGTTEYEKRLNEQIKIRLKLEEQIFGIRDNISKLLKNNKGKFVDEKDAEYADRVSALLKNINDGRLAKMDIPGLSSFLQKYQGIEESVIRRVDANRELQQTQAEINKLIEDAAKADERNARAAERAAEKRSKAEEKAARDRIKEAEEIEKAQTRAQEQREKAAKEESARIEKQTDLYNKQLELQKEALRLSEEAKKYGNQEGADRLTGIIRNMNNSNISPVDFDDPSSLLSTERLNDRSKYLADIDRELKSVAKGQHEWVKSINETEAALKQEHDIRKKISEDEQKRLDQQEALFDKMSKYRAKLAEMSGFNNVDTTAINDLSTKIDDIWNKIEQNPAQNVLKEAGKELTKINDQINDIDKSIKKPGSEIDSFISRISGFTKSKDFMRSNEDNLLKNYIGTPEQMQAIIAARNEIIALRDEVINLNREFAGDEAEQYTKRFERAAGEYERAISNVWKNTSKTGELLEIPQSVIDKIEAFKQKIREVNDIAPNTKIQWETKIEGDIVRLTGRYTDQAGALRTLTYEANKATGGMRSLSDVEKQSLTFTERMTKLFKQRGEALIAYIGTFASFYRVMSKVREGVEIIKLIDTNMTELRRVSGATRTELEAFKSTVYDTGREIGSTGDNIIKLAAEYARLGYSLKESSELAKSSAIYMNVGFIDDANFAMQSLTSTMKAYGLQANDVMNIVDKFNEVGKLLPLNGYIGQRVGTPETELRTNMLPRCA